MLTVLKLALLYMLTVLKRALLKLAGVGVDLLILLTGAARVRNCPHCGAADAGYGDLDADYGPAEAGYEPGARLDCAACGGPIVVAADGSFRAPECRSNREGGASCPK